MREKRTNGDRAWGSKFGQTSYPKEQIHVPLHLKQACRECPYCYIFDVGVRFFVPAMVENSRSPTHPFGGNPIRVF